MDDTAMRITRKTKHRFELFITVRFRIPPCLQCNPPLWLILLMDSDGGRVTRRIARIRKPAARYEENNHRRHVDVPPVMSQDRSGPSFNSIIFCIERLFARSRTQK